MSNKRKTGTKYMEKIEIQDTLSFKILIAEFINYYLIMIINLLFKFNDDGTMQR